MNPESRPYPAGTGGEGPRELHSQLIPHTSYSRSEEVQCGCSLINDHKGSHHRHNRTRNSVYVEALYRIMLMANRGNVIIVPNSVAVHHTTLLQP